MRVAVSYPFAVPDLATGRPGHPSMTHKPYTGNQRVEAYSLVELVCATALVGGTLAPTIALLRDGMELSRTTDRRLLLCNYCVSLMEQQMAATAVAWSPGDYSGDLAADGHADLRYTATRSDAASDGGVEGLLMHIRVTTYWDDDGDDAIGAGEKRCEFRTKVGKLACYESIANP